MARRIPVWKVYLVVQILSYNNRKGLNLSLKEITFQTGVSEASVCNIRKKYFTRVYHRNTKALPRNKPKKAVKNIRLP
jgi:hypothetical protein